MDTAELVAASVSEWSVVGTNRVRPLAYARSYQTNKAPEIGS